MPNNLMPTTTDDDGEPVAWYDGEAGEVFRLSSKSHWDVPIRLPNGALLHMLCSHPTPPAFDGPEARNKRRNHDEIRFWADYVENASYIIDDKGNFGGLARGAAFVIAGDLNADPDEGQSLRDPIGLLLSTKAVGDDPRPVADVESTRLDADDTALFGLRVDYVLPSRTVAVLGSGVWRQLPDLAEVSGTEDAPTKRFPSDHFPVWVDIAVPAPPAHPATGPAAGR